MRCRDDRKHTHGEWDKRPTRQATPKVRTCRVGTFSDAYSAITRLLESTLQVGLQALEADLQRHQNR